MKARLLLIIAAVALLPLGGAGAQITNPCWCPPLSYPPTGQLINWDSSIVFDTCGIRYSSANCDSAFWNNTAWHFYPEAMENVYAKKFWDVRFDVPAIPLDSVRSDSLLYVTLNAIDSINYPNIKNGFKQLENNYGNYRLRKINPSETTGDDSQYFSLYFDNYVKIQEVTYNLDTMEHVYCEFENWPILNGSDVNDKVINNDFKIELDDTQKFIKITLNKNMKINNIKIYNIMGELFYNYNCTSCFDNEYFMINTDNYPSGIYIIAINERAFKLIIMR